MQFDIELYGIKFSDFLKNLKKKSDDDELLKLLWLVDPASASLLHSILIDANGLLKEFLDPGLKAMTVIKGGKRVKKGGASLNISILLIMTLYVLTIVKAYSLDDSNLKASADINRDVCVSGAGKARCAAMATMGPNWLEFVGKDAGQGPDYPTQTLIQWMLGWNPSQELVNQYNKKYADWLQTRDKITIANKAMGEEVQAKAIEEEIKGQMQQSVINRQTMETKIILTNAERDKIQATDALHSTFISEDLIRQLETSNAQIVQTQRELINMWKGVAGCLIGAIFFIIYNQKTGQRYPPNNFSELPDNGMSNNGMSYNGMSNNRITNDGISYNANEIEYRGGRKSRRVRKQKKRSTRRYRK